MLQRWLTQLRQWRERRRAEARWRTAMLVAEHLIIEWQERNWWRYPPSEGWHIGYTTNRLPRELWEHVEKHGRIVPPTREEILTAIGMDMPKSWNPSCLPPAR